jgi:hypothetical protein
MDQLTAQTATVIGTANSHAWSQASKISTSQGEGVVLITLRYNGESELIDLAAIGGSILDEIVKTSRLSQDDVSSLGDGISIDAVLLVLRQNTMVITGVGTVEIYLGRGSKVGKIYAGSDALVTADGAIQPGDVVISTNKETSTALTLDEIRATLAVGTSAIDKLAVAVSGQKNSSGMVLVVADITQPPIETPDIPTAPRMPTLIKDTGVVNILTHLKDKLAFQRPLFISPEKRAKNVWIGTVLLILLFLGIIVGTVRRSKILKEAEFFRIENDVTQKIKEAKSIGDLNPERAKLILKQSNDELDTYLTQKIDPSYQKKAQDLQQQVHATETEVFKKQEVALTTLIELKLIKNDLHTTTLTADPQGNLLMPDRGSMHIEGVSSQDKSVFDVDTSQIGQVKELGFTTKKTYGLVDQGVADISKSGSSVIIQPDELWKDVQYLDVFAGNVYLLDKGQSEIWKYPALDSGFGTRRRWLAVGIQPDLSNVIDMKVDGDVWLLTNSGKLLRYSRGVPVPFSMEGFPAQDGDKLTDPRAIYVTDNKVYVLEDGAQRVVVFDEDSGKYDKQYSAEDLGNGKDLVVYKDRGYVLMDDKIVWFQL